MQHLNLNDPASDSSVAENVARLKALFPELVTEGKQGASVNLDVLKQLVGDHTITDADERYGLGWFGKREARKLALTPSLGTLRPMPDESVDWDTTKNLMIEGDNLEVLKLLQKSYAGKVKLIYIDPPYNTGKDFVYPDNFVDGIKNYKELTGQTEGGKPLTSNVESSGRFHTDWLNMMYPRLKLARELLRDDGVIFVSIDQGEVANLRQVLDELFGAENFINLFSWVRTRTPAALSQKTKTTTEYVIGYERSRTNQALLGIEKPVQSANTLLNQPNPVSTLKFPAGIETGIGDGKIRAGKYGSETYTVELLDDVEISQGLIKEPFRLRARFRWSQKYFEDQISEGTKIRIATEKFLPSYEKESYGRESLPNLIDDSVGVGTNESAGVELETLMGIKVFTYPKPLSLLQYLINSCTTDDDLILDFFAGSGTTAHAVWNLNSADGHARRTILVQLPEPIDPRNSDQESAAKFCDSVGKSRTIAELTKERLRRAGVKAKTENPDWKSDVGFRVFKLDTSNIRPWNPDRNDLDQTLLDHQEHLQADRSELDLLYELLLKRGINLSAPIKQRKGKQLDSRLRGNDDIIVHSVGGGSLMACLTTRIETEMVDALADGIIAWRDELKPSGETTCIFRDSAFVDDVAKTNLTAILEQNDIKNIRSL